MVGSAWQFIRFRSKYLDQKGWKRYGLVAYSAEGERAVGSAGHRRRGDPRSAGYRRRGDPRSAGYRRRGDPRSAEHRHAKPKTAGTGRTGKGSAGTWRLVAQATQRPQEPQEAAGDRARGTGGPRGGGQRAQPIGCLGTAKEDGGPRLPAGHAAAEHYSAAEQHVAADQHPEREWDVNRPRETAHPAQPRRRAPGHQLQRDGQRV